MLTSLNRTSRERCNKNDVESFLQRIDKQLDRLVGNASAFMDKETHRSELEANLDRTLSSENGWVRV